MVPTSFLRHHKAKSDDPKRFAVAHGFRSSFRDWASEYGYPHDVAERALAHTIKDKTEGAYHRTNLLPQRTQMMQKWADFLATSEQKNSEK
jgi:integrase